MCSSPPPPPPPRLLCKGVAVYYSGVLALGTFGIALQELRIFKAKVGFYNKVSRAITSEKKSSNSAAAAPASPKAPKSSKRSKK